LIPECGDRLSALAVWRALRWLATQDAPVTLSPASERTAPAELLHGLVDATRNLPPSIRKHVWLEVIRLFPRILGFAAESLSQFGAELLDATISQLSETLDAEALAPDGELDRASRDSLQLLVVLPYVAERVGKADSDALLSMFERHLSNRLEKLTETSSMTFWDRCLIEATALAGTKKPELLNPTDVLDDNDADGSWERSTQVLPPIRTAWLTHALAIGFRMSHDKTLAASSDTLLQHLESICDEAASDAFWRLQPTHYLSRSCR
jgi:hypothetical protein